MRLFKHYLQTEYAEDSQEYRDGRQGYFLEAAESVSKFLIQDTNIHLLLFSPEDLPAQVARLHFSPQDQKWRECLVQGSQLDVLNTHPTYPV